MASATETLADFTNANIRALQTLTDQGIEIRSFPVAIIKAAAREAKALLQEVAYDALLAAHRCALHRAVKLLSLTRGVPFLVLRHN